MPKLSWSSCTIAEGMLWRCPQAFFHCFSHWAVKLIDLGSGVYAEWEAIGQFWGEGGVDYLALLSPCGLAVANPV